MTEENKIIIINRLKSLAWRIGMMMIAIGIDFVLQNIRLFNLPVQATIVIGLVLGEVSKYLNTRTK